MIARALATLRAWWHGYDPLRDGHVRHLHETRRALVAEGRASQRATQHIRRGNVFSDAMSGDRDGGTP